MISLPTHAHYLLVLLFYLFGDCIGGIILMGQARMFQHSTTRPCCRSAKTRKDPNVWTLSLDAFGAIKNTLDPSSLGDLFLCLSWWSASNDMIWVWVKVGYPKTRWSYHIPSDQTRPNQNLWISLNLWVYLFDPNSSIVQKMGVPIDLQLWSVAISINTFNFIILGSKLFQTFSNQGRTPKYTLAHKTHALL